MLCERTCIAELHLWLLGGATEWVERRRDGNGGFAVKNSGGMCNNQAGNDGPE